MWIVAYYVVFAIYRYALTPDYQRIFEKLAHNFDIKLDYIPLTFMLAFFVSVIAERWRKILNNMGWIENCALTVNAILKSSTNHEEARLMKRSIVRYMILSQILTFRDISMRVRRRFPDLASLVTSGLMHEHELELLESVNVAIFNKYWLPVNWAYAVIGDAYHKGYIINAPSLNSMIKEVNDFRNGLQLLCNYDWVPIPIAYPQVVFLAVRCYFTICLISRQYLIGDGASNTDTIDMYVPFMTMLQFLFFVAWMKVAEALLNPLGEDDDDFECNFLIDRNITLGMAIVDQTADQYPPLTTDDLSAPDLMFLNYNKSDTHHELLGSVASVELPASNPADNWSRKQRTSASSSNVSSRRQSFDGKKSDNESHTPKPRNLLGIDNLAYSSTRRSPRIERTLKPVDEEKADSQESDLDGYVAIKL
ncbi:unnamed protein product [Cylicocyclus nassatus]|uniref:Bestrophin homolog n=1 Tax=Cylicocyclus nassatus TaxID=53992 RepID=A0AA36H550_CYLNA|nr:unnamed protein product [Cylicocyclus nassatus]